MTYELGLSIWPDDEMLVTRHTEAVSLHGRTSGHPTLRYVIVFEAKHLPKLMEAVRLLSTPTVVGPEIAPVSESVGEIVVRAEMPSQ